MKKCRVWLYGKKLLDAQLIGEKALTQRVLIPGTAWWDDADEERREDIMQYILYYDEWMELSTPAWKEFLVSALKDPHCFFAEEFEPAVEIDGVPYYVPFVYFGYFVGAHLSNRFGKDYIYRKEVCTVKYGEIDLSGNIVTPLEDDLAEQRNTIRIWEDDFAIVHKNGKFLIRRYDDKILREIETIEPNVEEEIKTEFDTGLDDDRTHWIFTQWNANR